MITQFQLKDFKAHRDTKLALKQLTMLVGDNASGKSSVLQALHLQMAAARNPKVEFGGGLAHRELCRQGGSNKFTLSAENRIAESTYELELLIQQVDRLDWKAFFTGLGPEGEFQATAALSVGERSFALDDTANWGAVRAAASPVTLYRFDPEAIAAGAYCDRPNTPVGADGGQTATALAALKLGNEEAFERIEAAMRELVPSLRRIRIRPVDVRRPVQKDLVVGSKVYFDFQGTSDVPAHHASHGTLILLALLTVLHWRDRRPDLILLDDFDHALHPRAQLDLIRMLTGLLEQEGFRGTQIVAATHSPYMLDALPPENVIAFAQRDDGTVASKSLAQHPDAVKANGALKSGELWSPGAERTWVSGG
jgi:predicted ATPase